MISFVYSSSFTTRSCSWACKSPATSIKVARRLPILFPVSGYMLRKAMLILERAMSLVIMSLMRGVCIFLRMRLRLPSLKMRLVNAGHEAGAATTSELEFPASSDELNVGC